MPFSIFNKKSDHTIPQLIFKGIKIPQKLFSVHSRQPIYNNDMVTTVSRMKTFERKKKLWDDDIINNKIKNFAEAGFFYRQSTKSIICYLCGLQLRNIKYIQCPFEIHIKNNSSCTHIILMKNESTNKSNSEFCNSLEISNESKCVVCKTEIPKILLLPCRHYCTCKTCTANIVKCPMCRQTIKAFTHVYNI